MTIKGMYVEERGDCPIHFNSKHCLIDNLTNQERSTSNKTVTQLFKNRVFNQVSFP